MQAGAELEDGTETGKLATGPEQLRMIEARSMCSVHGVKMGECFFKHQHVRMLVPGESGEQVSIHLPCGHIVDRPERAERIVCVCGKRWDVWLVENGQVWNAREVE